MAPAQRNSNALNRAWVYRWNSVRYKDSMANASIITLNCLKVDRAIVFFRSLSWLAATAAINIVNAETKRRLGLKKSHADKEEWNRIKRKIPAVTRVEECTNAETGVGAAIAAGSQAENGICALFVIPAIIIQMANQEDRVKSQEIRILQ